MDRTNHSPELVLCYMVACHKNDELMRFVSCNKEINKCAIFLPDYNRELKFLETIFYNILNRNTCLGN